MVSEVKAETIGRAARRDLQIAVPVRPAVRRGVRLRQVGDSVMLDGSDRPQVFTGGFARESLVRLVAACDGTATHAELADAVGLDEAAVYKSVALLWASGVLEEGVPGDDDKSVPPEFACFLSRLGNSTGANRSWTDSAARLARSAVRLTGDRLLVEAATRAFGGVCDVVVDADGRRTAENELVVFFETSESQPELAGLQHRCWAENRPLLRVRADATSLVVGPYVDPSFTPCLQCGTSGEGKLSGNPPERAHDLVAGLVAHHVVALVSRATMTHLPLDASVIDLTTLSTKYRASATRAGCPTCSFSEGPEASSPPACSAYEAAVAIPPRRFLDPKGHLAHYQSSNIRLQSEFREWPSCPQVPLPDPDVSRLAGAHRRAASERRAAIGLDDVGLLLKVAFGIRDQSSDGWVKRWTAAAGNIGSATAYLVSRDESVLPVGVYAYNERDHALAQLSTSVPPGDRRLLLVVTGNLKKVVRKYGTFGLRLALLDAGCALTSAREVAEHVALDFSLDKDWDDDSLSEHLGISPDEEPVAAVMGLG
ncbi:tpaE [Streptomyces sp. NPDC005202]|uniref:tpaE n=1 Tax=Streptomyces sp. NPDC005202 TaxID=3157021 RepID=UPI0033A06D2B